jgi:regulatory protein
MTEGNFSFNEIKLKIEHFCAYQDRCVFEIQTKLQDYNLSKENQNKLIDYLVAEKFLDEKRFAESFVSGKFKIKMWGRQKIKQALRLKKVDEQLIQTAIFSIDDDDYLRVVRNLIVKKWNELSREKDEWIKKSKTIRFLQSRGFESDIILSEFKTLKESQVI